MGETEADRLLRHQLGEAQTRRLVDQEADRERDRQAKAQLEQEEQEKDREAAALIHSILGLLQRLGYPGMEPVEIHRAHREGVRGKRKIRHFPAVVKAGWRIGEYPSRIIGSTLEYGGTVRRKFTDAVYLLSDGRVVATVNHYVWPDGHATIPQPDDPWLPPPLRYVPPGQMHARLEDGTDAFPVPAGRYPEKSSAIASSGRPRSHGEIAKVVIDFACFKMATVYDYMEPPSFPELKNAYMHVKQLRTTGDLTLEVTVILGEGEYMPRKFNPPPGWPPPPPGWQPGPNWQPDPSWPSPPTGWSFWIDEPAATMQAWSGQAVQVRAAVSAEASSPPPLVQPQFSSQPPSGRHSTLASEQVVIAAPMSFAGSAQRLAKLPRSVASPYLRSFIWAVTIVLIAMVWMFVLAWYLTWGLLLVPYRIIRRGQRKQKVERLRHRETIERLDRR